MKIVVLSAHPDDAETGAGGFSARAAQAGHDVVILHISKEVRDRKIDGIPGAAVRTAEAVEAARILGVQVAFLDHCMGECPATKESSQEMEAFLRRQRPDLVLTQWPLDTHPDHQVVGVLPLRAHVWHQSFCLAFYEVCAGIQTIDFQPNRHVDISAWVEQKRQAVLAHRSRTPEEQVQIHEKMSAYRGLELGVAHAEAFHVLGGQAKTTFDRLFDDRRVYGQSGGIDALEFPPAEWDAATMICLRKAGRMRPRSAVPTTRSTPRPSARSASIEAPIKTAAMTAAVMLVMVRTPGAQGGEPDRGGAGPVRDMLARFRRHCAHTAEPPP